MEYAFLILNKRAYDTFERELYTNASEFIRCDIVLNNLKVLVRSKLGLVYSKHVKLSGNYQVVNAAFDMLQMIISSSYKQDYAIYQNSSKTYNNYKLKDMGIDLENDYIKDTIPLEEVNKIYNTFYESMELWGKILRYMWW